MAPEQFRGGTVSGRTDIYALGVLSYQLATGTLPFSPHKLTTLMRSAPGGPSPVAAVAGPGHVLEVVGHHAPRHGQGPRGAFPMRAR